MEVDSLVTTLSEHGPNSLIQNNTLLPQPPSPAINAGIRVVEKVGDGDVQFIPKSRTL